MNKIKISLLSFTAVGALGLVLSYSAEDSKPALNDNPESQKIASAVVEGSSTQAKPIIIPNSDSSLSDEEKERAAVIAMLQTKFSSITHRHTQVKAVEKLVAYLQDKYGEKWLEHFDAYLAEAFPEYADALFELYASMQQYNQWLAGERQNMMAMTPDARRQLLWNMRESFFGEAAQEIWAEALKSEQVLLSLQEINEADSSVGFEEHHASYLASISDAYGDRADHMLGNRRQEFVDRFLSIRTIQDRLHEMKKEDRYQALSDFRSSMGMDDAAVARWQELDKVRDMRWEQGRRYMEEKQKLQSSMSESDFHLALTQLQDEYFGDNAEIIRNEEESGYYRFKETQLLGKN